MNLVEPKNNTRKKKGAYICIFKETFFFDYNKKPTLTKKYEKKSQERYLILHSLREIDAYAFKKKKKKSISVSANEFYS